MDFVKNFTVTKEDGSQVQVSGEIPFDQLEKHRPAAIKHYGKDMEIDGFRKGHVPDDEVVKRVGEMTILSDMAERALAEVYPELCKVHTIDAIGHPKISLTKLADGNPLGFTLTVAVLPEVSLPDYKKIAADINKEKASAEVTDEEVDAQIKDILRQKIAYERMQKLAQKKAQAEQKAKDMGDATELPTPDTVTDKTEGNSEEEDTDVKAVTDEEIPELTDDLVKELGQPGQFTSVADFKEKIKEHLSIEKEREVNASHRAKITDKIIEESDIDLPQILIDSEIDQMFAQMNEDLTRANLKMEDYLAHIKKTKEDLAAEWKPAAEKRAKLQLVLNEIAKAEDIEPDKQQLEAQVSQLLEQYKDADKQRVRIYVASVLTNEAVMQMLEQET